MPIMKSIVLLARTEIKISNRNSLGFCFTLRHHLSLFSSFHSHLKLPHSRKRIILDTRNKGDGLKEKREEEESIHPFSSISLPEPHLTIFNLF